MSYYYLTALNEYILQKGTTSCRVRRKKGGPVFVSTGKRGGGGGEYSGDMEEVLSG